MWLGRAKILHAKFWSLPPQDFACLYDASLQDGDEARTVFKDADIVEDVALDD